MFLVSSCSCLFPIHWSHEGVKSRSDVVGAAATGDAPTISEWSIIVLPTEVFRMYWRFEGSDFSKCKNIGCKWCMIVFHPKYWNQLLMNWVLRLKIWSIFLLKHLACSVTYWPLSILPSISKQIQLAKVHHLSWCSSGKWFRKKRKIMS